jgi:alpha-tubulin suppressor-like RCC1 family protein
MKQIEYFKNIFIVDVVCGFYHCLAISNKGEIFAWGENRYGQLGNGKSGKNENQLTPIKIF